MQKRPASHSDGETRWSTYITYYRDIKETNQTCKRDLLHTVTAILDGVPILHITEA